MKILDNFKKQSHKSYSASLRIAVVGDICAYTLQLLEALSRIPYVSCRLYGPRKNPLGKIKDNISIRNYKPIWTTHGYVLQIPIQAVRDRLKVINLDFTLTTFGRSYLSCVPLPLLIILLRILGIKVVATVHDVVTEAVLGQFYEMKNLKKRFIVAMLQFFYKLLSLTCTITVPLKVLKNMLVKEFHIPEARIFVIPFGVNEFPVVPKAILDFWAQKFANKKIVLFFGVVSPRKGIEYLIDGFSLIANNFPDIILVIAGPPDSKYRKYLDNLLKKASKMIDAARFIYLGYLKDIDAHALLQISKVVVLPYVYNYASPSILYWVIQNRKPVIASDINTLSEELEGYPEDLLVPPRDSKRIASALENIISDEKLEAEAIQFITSKADLISLDKVALNLLKLYLKHL